MIDCYCYPTPNSRRVTMMLEECGLPYRRWPIDLTRGEQRDPGFLAINPAGAVPVIRDDDGPDGEPLLLTQSAAICLYLAEKAGRLLSTGGRERAEVMQWFAFGTTDLSATASSIYRLSLTEDAASPALTSAHDRLRSQAALLDARLRDRPFLCDAFSIADIATYPVLISAFIEAILTPVAGLDSLRRWMRAIGERPAIARGL